MFKLGRKARIFYHKHAINQASPLNQAFVIFYNMFASAERRNGLLDMWNIHFFISFYEKK